MPEFESLPGDLHKDVLIIGGGMAGLLTAWQLENCGVDYALIEADRICRGVSRNTTAKITSQHGFVFDRLLRQFGAEKARLYYQAQERALAQYKALAKRIDCDLEVKDNYIYTVSQPKKLEKEIKALENLQIPFDFVEELKLPFPTAGAVRLREQAQFHPMKLMAALAKSLHIYEHTRALEFRGNRVVTDQGTITAEKIVVATHFPFLNKHGGYSLKMFQERSYALGLANAPDVDGMYLDENGASLRNYRDLLILGGGSHRTGKKSEGWRGLERFAESWFPQGEIRYRWATQDCMTLDGVPYIGQYGGRTPELFVATGFNKWGMTGSMAAASVLGDLVQEVPNAFREVFSPQRTSLRPLLGRNALEALGNLLTFRTPGAPIWDAPCGGTSRNEAGIAPAMAPGLQSAESYWITLPQGI